MAPTCATAKFAILALITDKAHRQMIMSDASFTEYFAALRRAHIRLAPYSRFDITPVLDSIRTNHDNPKLSLRILTAKVCFLLGIMGFLRAADINSIDRDDSYIHGVTGYFHLSIIKPKERRQGFSITKEITIAPFAKDPMLCPVRAYNTYCERTPAPCQQPFPDFDNQPKPFFTPLIRNLGNLALTVSPDSIRRHIRHFIVDPSGVAIDDVLVQGNWTSRNVFHDHYRLSSALIIHDGIHTNEDTLKLLEIASLCLQTEKGRYQQVSHHTFAKRRIFALQFVENKLTLLSAFVASNDLWACLWERSALVPRKWDERKYWVSAIELLARLMDLLNERNEVSSELINEQTGLKSVAKEDRLRRYYTHHPFVPFVAPRPSP
ncbi:hypothetical protein DM01DRAFT_358323 [Hesseltinella vesiculosa]|uniref:Uncharacterized protein n=1 Tax=Hesseltinella vesiculosa TaxID=101127 RepID=A0A1X2G344_9FUNG|nr:hypothetical protein DM01DRAFT_358323 [Hesseltinella vesiculosa]